MLDQEQVYQLRAAGDLLLVLRATPGLAGDLLIVSLLPSLPLELLLPLVSTSFDPLRPDGICDVLFVSGAAFFAASRAFFRSAAFLASSFSSSFLFLSSSSNFSFCSATAWTSSIMLVA